MKVILPAHINISSHTAQRFLERIIGKERYTAEDEQTASIVIQNLLLNRVLQQRSLGNDKVQLKYRNAVFVYDVDSEFVITVYPDDNYPKYKEEVEWIYKFPPSLQFKGVVEASEKLELIVKGFTPVRVEGRAIIGRVNNSFYKYDPKYNVISWLGDADV